MPTQQEARSSLGIPEDVTVVTLLPISRQQEVRYILPDVLATAALVQQRDSTTHFILPVVRWIYLIKSSQNVIKHLQR